MTTIPNSSGGRAAADRSAATLTCLSSMATRGLLAELAAAFGSGVVLDATGGVEAARRVRDGEVVDVVILAEAVMRQLEAEGHLVQGSLRPVVRSSMAAAVRTGKSLALADEADVRSAMLEAARTGYSTGPSGTHLLGLIERLGLRDMLGDRLVQAPPGVPVGRLLAEGKVDLAFQQRSELMGIDGISVVALPPAPVGADTVFTAGTSARCSDPRSANQFAEFLASPATADAKRRHGMEAP